MTELLGCPFCGGEAVVEFHELSEGWDVFCPKPENECVGPAAYDQVKAVAIAAWNRRALPAPAELAGVVPVAWRVKDFADGWILCHSEAEARREAEGAGNLVQPLVPAHVLTTLTTANAALEQQLAAANEARVEAERAERALDFIARWLWDKENLSDKERLSIVKYHPFIKARALIALSNGGGHG